MQNSCIYVTGSGAVAKVTKKMKPEFRCERQLTSKLSTKWFGEDLTRQRYHL
jgi:hypothetical protein